MTSTARHTLLADAVALWRGDPLPDLHHVRSPDVVVEIDQVRIRHVSHLLTLGELRLVADDAAASFALAERALSLEPFDGPRSPRRPRRGPQGPPSRPDRGGAPAGWLGTEAAWRPAGPADRDPPAAGGPLGQRRGNPSPVSIVLEMAP